MKFYENCVARSKKLTVQHFMMEGMSKSTIYNIIRNYEDRGTVKRKRGSTLEATIMTNEKKRKIQRMFDHKDNVSIRQAGRKFDCSQFLIVKTLNKMCNVRRKKKEGPFI